MKGNIIDLFSGAGGFSLGAHQSGFNVELAIDIDREITSSYNINFPSTPLAISDISDTEPSALLSEYRIKTSNIDVVMGGPPCQGFSFIGKRDSSDPRNTLIASYFEYVRFVQPRFFVFENVPGLLTAESRPHLDSGLNLLPSFYDILDPIIIDASEYGVPTFRKRVIVIGVDTRHADKVVENDLLQKKSNTLCTVHDALHDLPNMDDSITDEFGNCWSSAFTKSKLGAKGKFAREARKAPGNNLASYLSREVYRRGIVSGFQKTKHTTKTIKRFSSVKPGKYDKVSKCPRLTFDGFCPTLRAGTGKDRGSYQSIRPIHPAENRVINVREASRIQGFPDWFYFHPTKWHSFRMIGNSVSPYVSKAIFSILSEKY